jgi:predicted O-methyltransferase YrrM
MDEAMSRLDVNAIIERELPQLQGWCTTEKGVRMAELVRGASLCVELGVFGGRGTVAMALTLADQGFGRVDGIDPFTPTASLEGTNDTANDLWWKNLDYEAIARSAQEAIDRLGLSQHARLVRLRSLDAVGSYADGTIDALHQDSNHSSEISCEEVARWALKIRAGGYWFFDDADWPTTQKAQRDLEALGFSLVEDHTKWKVYRKLQ